MPAVTLSMRAIMNALLSLTTNQQQRQQAERPKTVHSPWQVRDGPRGRRRSGTVAGGGRLVACYVRRREIRPPAGRICCAASPQVAVSSTSTGTDGAVTYSCRTNA